MYELLTGRLPFEAPGQVVRGNPAAPSSLRADLDPRLEAICLKAMAASREARYASMGDLATALTDYLRLATDKSPEIKAAIAPSGPRVPEPSPTAPSRQDAQPPSATKKIVAGGSIALVAVVGASVGLWSWMSGGPGKGAPTAPDRPGIAQRPGSATLIGPARANPDRFMDDAWRAIREGRFDEARATLARYIAEPAASKNSEARSLLADLDHAISKGEARTRAKAQGDAELKKHVDEGVSDLVDVIQTPDLRDAYAANLLEAFRQEQAARSTAVSSGELAANTRRPGISKKATRPLQPGPVRGGGTAAVPVRELEPGFKFIYNGQSFEGWDASIRRMVPARKGIPKGVTDYFGCNPQTVARREGNSLISNTAAVGMLRTEKLFQLTSFKFDYMIILTSGRPVPKARNVHAVAELFLDKPLDVKNMNACGVIAVSLNVAAAGNVQASKAGNRRQVAMQPAIASAAYQNGVWNAMEIKYADRSIEFLLNGTLVNRLEIPRRITVKVAFSFGNVELHLANLRLH